jgi:Uma2 family endonuclease
MPIRVPQIEAVIPDGITTQAAFRRWAVSDDFPSQGRFAFFDGALWMDLSLEYAFSHNMVKSEFAAVLSTLVTNGDIGLYFMEGMLLSNVDAGLSTVPDGAFVSHESFERGAARRVGGTGEDFVELLGSPDMVLEVVSKSSVEKDTADLVELYWQAGVAEYWLVDARGEPLRFDVYRHGSKGYAEVRRQAGGWLKSGVFGRSFRLTSGTNRGGDPAFTLEVK